VVFVLPPDDLRGSDPPPVALRVFQLELGARAEIDEWRMAILMIEARMADAEMRIGHRIAVALLLVFA
jgi:hypothetical protein